MNRNDHYAYQTLDAYLHRDLPLLKRLACAIHLRSCPRCAALLKRVREDNELFSRAVDALKGRGRSSGK